MQITQKHYSMQDLQNIVAAMAIDTQALKEAMQETDRQFKEYSKEADKRAKEMDKAIGRLTNRIGNLVEAMVGANIHTKFNEQFNFHFEAASPQYRIFENNIPLFEIDYYLKNKDAEMLVEVKTNVVQRDIDEHIERILKKKKHNLKNEDNIKVYGAIAGGIFTLEVKNYAFKNGLFVLEINGDNVNLEAPEKDKIKFW